MTPGAESAVDTRAARTRAFRTVAKLSAAAIEVFTERGFHPAQIADITEAAGVSRATFYNYFSSKEDLLRHMVLQATPDLLTTHSADSEDSTPIARIRASTSAYLAAYERHAILMHVWNEAAQRNPEMAALLQESRRPFLQRTEQHIRKLQDRGLADSELNPSYAAHALTGMVTHFAFAWFVEGEPFEHSAALDALTRLWANAIGLSMEVLNDDHR